MRLSIQPTYDSRETGPRFTVETRVADRFIKAEPIADPFVRTTVNVSLLDALRSLLRHGQVKVEVSVNGHPSIMEDILELDANYIGHNNTRRAEWNRSIEDALEQFAVTPEGK